MCGRHGFFLNWHFQFQPGAINRLGPALGEGGFSSRLAGHRRIGVGTHALRGRPGGHWRERGGRPRLNRPGRAAAAAAMVSVPCPPPMPGAHRRWCHACRRRRVPGQGKDHRAVSRRRLQGLRQLRPCERLAGQGRLGPARGRLRDDLRDGAPGEPGAEQHQGRAQGRREPDPRHRPGPRGRGHRLAGADLAPGEGRDRGEAGCAASTSTRSPRMGCATRWRIRATSTWTWCGRSRRAGHWTTWWASTSRRCCGARSPEAVRPGACSRWRSASSASARRRSSPSCRRSTGPWDVQLEAAGGGSFTARPVLLDGAELDRLGIGTGTMAEDAARRIREGRFTVATVERREIRRNPVPPFTTSTLQQDASRRTGFRGAPDHAARADALRGASRWAQARWGSSPTCAPAAPR